MTDSSILTQILTTLADLQATQQLLSQKVDKIQTESEHSPHGMKLHIDPHHYGHSDSDHDTVVSPTFAPKLDHAGLFAEKPILTSKDSTFLDH
ncbi:hypothetical protein BGZ95_008950 [Linnemannia exigua]|uniref:Uncharacterized protein n=1 Tax=Linnemannia exigua TaxID=604196 RepID=A0AAD4DDH2_9FUNG|nr:hypothetical protein BGZ95_008950 [Linnemannia exigua]